MKRVRDAAKPRRKFKAASVRSPGELLRLKHRKRLVGIDPNGDILEQIRNMTYGSKRHS